MSVHIVQTASRTKTKRKGIRIRSIYGVIPGLALLSPTMRQLSTIRRTTATRPIHVAIAGKNSLAPESHPLLSPGCQ